MSVSLPHQLIHVIDQLERLPGIGPKSAQRIAFYLLRQDKERLNKISDGITNLAEGINHCSECGMLTEDSVCSICSDKQREKDSLCVVEGALDVISIERTGDYRGLYHVIGGLLSPLDNIGPESLNISSLLSRIEKNKPKEIILALNPSTEGETTSLYLKNLLEKEEITLSRLAHGLPTGAAIEYADDLTISRALSGRQELKR